MVLLIWYTVILPCWCNSPMWILFGSPAPKLDIWSPQGVSVLINVASPNSRGLIQLWYDRWHICLTPPPHPALFPLPFCGTNSLSRFLCVAALMPHPFTRDTDTRGRRYCFPSREEWNRRLTCWDKTFLYTFELLLMACVSVEVGPSCLNQHQQMVAERLSLNNCIGWGHCFKPPSQNVFLLKNLKLIDSCTSEFCLQRL